MCFRRIHYLPQDHVPQVTHLAQQLVHDTCASQIIPTARGQGPPKVRLLACAGNNEVNDPVSFRNVSSEA